MPLQSTAARRILISVALAACAHAAWAQNPQLEDFYGFEDLEILRIDPGAGPMTSTDLEGDGLQDLIVVNNRKNRIELHHQIRDAKPSTEDFRPMRTNEIPQHWRFRRVEVPAINQVRAVLPYDFDKDGMMDLVYAGTDPGAVVFLRQTQPGTWEVANRKFITGLLPSRDALMIADVLGDETPELIGIVKGEIVIWPLEGDSLGQPTTLSGGDTIFAAVMAEDLDGNGTLDITGISPDNTAPVRLWLAEARDGEKRLGAQLRFEMPPLREGTAIRTPGNDASMLALIEKASKRVVLLELSSEEVEMSGDREAAYEVFTFEDPGNRERKLAVVDLDGDGAPDVLATNREANAVSIYRQSPEEGLSAPTLAPAYAELSGLSAGDVDGDGEPEVYMLSEAEGVVGRSSIKDGSLEFPKAIALSDGWEPVAIDLVELDGSQHLAVVTKDGRNYALELIGSAGEPKKIDLGSMSRAPETILGVDADHDGKSDLLLLTPDRDATLLLATENGEEGYELVESPGQEKLLRSAGPLNTGVLDFDGDDQKELLVADRNFIRALRYDRIAPEGTAGGWRVVDQINTPRTDIALVALEVLDEKTVAAADQENGHIVLFERDDAGEWKAGDTITLRGFRFDDLRTGGKDDANKELLAVGDAGFAVVRLSGSRAKLAEVGSWRPEEIQELPHELGSGDLNSDGLTDIVVLDAGTQTARILALSEAKRILPATSFEIFESRIFSGGEPRNFEPREVQIVDLTGDGRDDLVLLAHDRVLLYPQDSPETPASQE
jgi:hypothetical protein